MAATPAVPGFTLQARLRACGPGQVWDATDERRGRRVHLVVVPVADPVRREALRARVAAAAVAHPHLQPVTQVVDVPDALALVLPEPEAGTLGDLLRDRDRLSAGEVVTACAPVAQALAAAHEHGVVHGSLTPDEISFTAEGRPLLTGLGLAVPDGTVDEAGDVHALARVALRALAGAPAAGRPGSDVLRLAAGLDPARRPPAADLAAALFALAPPAPVVLPTPAVPRVAAGVRALRPAADADGSAAAALLPAHGPVAGERSRRLRWRPVAVALAVPFALAAAGLAGVRWAEQDRPDVAGSLEPVTAAAATGACGPAASVAADAAPEAGWRSVVADLYERRAAAFEALDPALLCDVYAEESRALAADLRVLAGYADQGVRPEGVRFEVLSVQPLDRGGETVRVEITDRGAGYDLVDGEGRVVQRHDALPQARWQADLVPVEDGAEPGWRFG